MATFEPAFFRRSTSRFSGPPPDPSIHLSRSVFFGRRSADLLSSDLSDYVLGPVRASIYLDRRGSIQIDLSR